MPKQPKKNPSKTRIQESIERPLLICLEKKDFHFCAAHMTVFSAREKEPLHGHNYSVRVELEVTRTLMIPFQDIKRPIRKLCSAWDERVLLPRKSPHFKIESQSPFRFSLCGKVYEIPVDETLLLPLDNITSENLSLLFCQLLKSEMKPQFDAGILLRLGVTISETDGQSVTAWETA